MSNNAINERSELMLGDRVFVVITPSTPHVRWQHYHPRPYFVLETTVKRASGGRCLGREFDTSFFVGPGRAFMDLQDAKKRLVEVFAEETCGAISIHNILLVSHKVEEETNEQIESNENRSNDGWPTPEQFERGWWTVPAGTPTHMQIMLEDDRRRRDLADMGYGPFF